MSTKCFVPNCEITEGIVFPEDTNVRQKWLEYLKITDIKPDETSFVCLKHLKEANLNQWEGSVEVETKETDTDISSKTEDVNEIVEPKGSTLQEQPIPDDNEPPKEVQVKNECNSNDKTHAVEHAPASACDNTVDMDTKVDTASENISISDDNTTESNIPEKDIITGNIESVKVIKEKKTCRLCAEEHWNTKNIFEEKVENVPVSVAIMECIYPIEILRNDKLSKEICESCLQCINSYFKFRSVCLDNDKKQRDFHGEDYKSPKILPTIKRKLESVGSSLLPKKLRVEEIITDSDDEYDDQDDDLDSLSNYLIKKEKIDEVEKVPEFSSSSTEPKQVSSKENEARIKEKFDKVEEELLKVLEGQLTEEQAQAENIIIHVADDDEEKTPDKIATLSKLKLPIVIKPVDMKKLKKNNQNVSSWNTMNTPKVSTIVKTGKSSEIILPKGINVKVKENYKSEIGVYEGKPVNYLFGVEFCEIDGYLLEYRLSKGTIRYLRCVIPTCQALAVQNRLKPGTYSKEITVQKPHNHRPLDKSEKKKQMFYYIMKHKMQSDKTLNFRGVYDEVCKSDPEIKHLVPLRNVINGICRHQLTHKIPQINSFDQFYNKIEDDIFQKLHFTHNGVQFYQERFTAEDDSKAVVFANADIIEQVSHSKLMYIDASFKIDTNEEFTYQLVTVLVWIEDSYYPILYALVNKKTQEIYKKVFNYLYSNLAPKLRPREIVTDYEANLYYALGETYLDSAIGGSVFYYTQNLYKKICSLNLSRDLETNSYFRNIYHMLLMLPLLPVNTILDGLNNMEIQAKDLGLTDLTRPIFDHVRKEWIVKVTPDLFCVHRLENRINENVIAPFKKLRDFIMLSKGKMQRQHTTIFTVVEKLIELEHFLQMTYSAPNKKSFARDLSSSQKKNVLKAWQYIESHPKININNFFSKVLGYIKCMENQLWIWGFYRYDGDVMDELINATNFSIVSNDMEVVVQNEGTEEVETEYAEPESESAEGENEQIVMEAVIDENGGFVLHNGESSDHRTPFENAFLKYVYKE